MAHLVHAGAMIDLGSRVSDPIGSGWVLGAALAMFVAGCGLLAIGGGSLGALHAFAGFIVLAIVGALNQLLPVLTHAPVARPYGVIAVAVGFFLGFTLLIAGFYGAHTFAAAGLVLAIVSTAWVVWNVWRLWTGRDEARTRIFMACAMLAFGFAAGIGATMAGVLAGRFTAPIGQLAPLHAVLAIAGFASLLVIAISYRFVPMFAVAHGDAYGRGAMAWVAAAGVAVTAAFLQSPFGLRLGLLGLLASGVMLGISHLQTLRTRMRKRIDVSLRYGGIAWGFGIAATIVAIAATWQHGLQTAAVILAVLGWISITILGYAYKIAGFLAWRAAKERRPAAQLPALSVAVPLPLAYLALASMAAGTILAAIGSSTWLGLAAAGYDLYAVGGVAATIALGNLVWLYRAGRETDGTAVRVPG